MEYRDMDGVFGTDAPTPSPQPCRSIRFSGDTVDWICTAILVVAALLAILFWGPLSDALFFRLLFPLCSVGGKLAAVVLLVLALVRWLDYRLRRYF